MSAPFHARDITGKGRYYGPCGEGCPLGEAIDGDDLLISVTNAQGIVNKPALVPSAAKITAETAWENLPLMVAMSRQPDEGIPCDGDPKTCDKRSPVSTRCGGCRFCLTMAIKAQHKEEWEAKADLGTRVHWYAHAHVTGRELPFDEEVEPYLQAYLRWLEDQDVDITRDDHVIAAETTVFDRKAKYAGTGDLWVNLKGFGRRGPADRGLVLVDFKSSMAKPRTTVYREQVLQLAALRYAPSTVLINDTEIKTPRFAGTALLNLRSFEDKASGLPYGFIPIDADKDAHRGFLGAVELARYLQHLDIKPWVVVDPANPGAAA